MLHVDDLRGAPRADGPPLHLDAAYDLCFGDCVGELICVSQKRAANRGRSRQGMTEMFRNGGLVLAVAYSSAYARR